MNRTQVLTFTEAFPPAHKLTQTMLDIDYIKHLNTFMDAVEVFCAFVVIFSQLIAQKWEEHNITERLQLVALTVREWAQNVAAPAIIEAARVTYNAGANVRRFHYIVSSPLFITL